MDLLALKMELAKEMEKAGVSLNFWEIEKSKYADLSIKGFKFRDRLEEVRLALANHPLVSKVSLDGPYINISLDRSRFSESVLSSILEEKADFGRQPKKNKKIVLEHTSVNPTGPIHIGRFRNPVIGDSLRRILDFLGYDVTVHYYVNDVGRQVALISLAREKGVKPDESLVRKYQDYLEKPDFQTFFVYVPAYQLLEGSEEFKEEVNEFMRRAELGDKSLLARLRETAEFCLEGQLETLKRCGFHYDRFVFESKFLESGEVDRIIKRLKRTGRIKELENGALALELRDLGSPRENTIILRSDGTSVYIIRDVAYHLEKLGEGDLSITVLGEDHKIEFQELKAIVGLLGEDPGRLEVVHFSFVNLEGKKMSTRKGETIPLDLVLDEGVDKARRIIEEKNPCLRNKGEIAEKVGIGAIKYSLVRVDPMKQITFNWEEALDFEGDTAPYIQYAGVRARSILRKARKDPETRSNTINDNEWSLIMSLAEFPEVVYQAGVSRKPNLVANYAYDLAKEFNEFYHTEKVIDSDQEGFRLGLVAGVVQVLENSLGLLGIDLPDKM